MHTQSTVVRIALSLYYSSRRVESPPRLIIVNPSERAALVPTWATGYVACPLEGVES